MPINSFNIQTGGLPLRQAYNKAALGIQDAVQQATGYVTTPDVVAASDLNQNGLRDSLPEVTSLIDALKSRIPGLNVTLAENQTANGFQPSQFTDPAVKRYADAQAKFLVEGDVTKNSFISADQGTLVPRLIASGIPADKIGPVQTDIINGYAVDSAVVNLTSDELVQTYGFPVGKAFSGETADIGDGKKVTYGKPGDAPGSFHTTGEFSDAFKANMTRLGLTPANWSNIEGTRNGNTLDAGSGQPWDKQTEADSYPFNVKTFTLPDGTQFENEAYTPNLSVIEANGNLTASDADGINSADIARARQINANGSVTIDVTTPDPVVTPPPVVVTPPPVVEVPPVAPPEPAPWTVRTGVVVGVGSNGPAGQYLAGSFGLQNGVVTLLEDVVGNGGAEGKVFFAKGNTITSPGKSTAEIQQALQSGSLILGARGETYIQPRLPSGGIDFGTNGIPVVIG